MSAGPSRIRAYPFLEMEALLTSLMAGIVNSMGSLYGEIGFYVAARAYVRFLQAKNVPYTWPDVGEQSAFQGMCDLCLLTGNTEHIAPNDYGASDKDGALLLGDNGNGKTVFLRSIMTCQLLAQGGLPIPPPPERSSCIPACAPNSRRARSRTRPRSRWDALSRRCGSFTPFWRKSRPTAC